MLTAAPQPQSRPRPSRLAAAAAAVAMVMTIGTVMTMAAIPARADSVRAAQQWVLNAINAPAAWQRSRGHGVIVAVIDSGVAPSVSDLGGSVITGPDLTGVGTSPNNPDWGVHGTWMASLIAGHGHGADNDSGILGVAPDASVLSIRVITDQGDPGYARYEREPVSRSWRQLAEAIRYATGHGAGVISMSLGYTTASRSVRQALQDALNHGVVVVASSGNSGAPGDAGGSGHAPYSYPANYPGVLGVAAVDQAGGPASFSSDNLSVQVAAPGVKVPAQGNDGLYWLVSGTSPACALTAGVAALIKSSYPRLSPALVSQAITTTTTNRPPGGYDDRVGFGTVDAAAALTEAGRLARQSRRRHDTAAAARFFGGGPAAVPPAPIGPRGLQVLVLLSLLAAACLALVGGSAVRLAAMRRTAVRHGLSPATGPAGTASTAFPAGTGGPAGQQAATPASRQSGRAMAGSRFSWPAPPPGRHAAPGGRDGAAGARE